MVTVEEAYDSTTRLEMAERHQADAAWTPQELFCEKGALAGSLIPYPCSTAARSVTHHPEATMSTTDSTPSTTVINAPSSSWSRTLILGTSMVATIGFCTLHERAETRRAIQSALGQKNEQIASQDRQISDQGGRIVTLEWSKWSALEALDEALTTIDGLTAAVHQRDDKVRALSATVAQRDDQARAQARTITQQAASIGRLTEEKSALQGALANANGTIRRQKADLASASVTIDDQKHTLDVVRHTVIMKEGELTSLNYQLFARDVQAKCAAKARDWRSTAAVRRCWSP